MTQEQLAEITDVASNSISRIERGLLMPALPTLIDICNALGTGADSILAAYIAADTPIRWTPLAEKLGGLDLEKQHKIEDILAYTGSNLPAARRISARWPEKTCHPAGRVRQ